MKPILAQALTERGIINDNTRIRALCPVRLMGGAPSTHNLTLTVDRVMFMDDAVIIDASHKDGRKFRVPAEQIYEVDGMDPARLAAAYDIKPDGLKKIAGKKRGRKSKQGVYISVNKQQ